jgi:hypothetical protein
MGDVIDSFGVCEAEVCKRQSRILTSEDDIVRIDRRQYHKGCEPPQQEGSGRSSL